MTKKEEISNVAISIGEKLVYLALMGLILGGLCFAVVKLGGDVIDDIDKHNAETIENYMETRYYKIVWDDDNNLEELLSKYKKGYQTTYILVDGQIMDKPSNRVQYELNLYTDKGKLHVLQNAPLTAWWNVALRGNKSMKVFDIEDTVQDNALMLKVTTLPEYFPLGIYAVTEGDLFGGKRVYQLLPVDLTKQLEANGTFEDPYMLRFTQEFFIDLQYDVIYVEGQGYIMKNTNGSISLLPFVSERPLWVDSDFVK